LPQTFVVSRYQHSLVSYWVGPVVANRLKQAQKYDAAIAKTAFQRNLLPGIVAPLQLGILHEERLIVVPT
jgi:hypothetical protein